MDVKTPLKRLLEDSDTDEAINFLDSEPVDKRFQGPIGEKTKKLKF